MSFENIESQFKSNDPYEVLGVDKKNASDAEIKKAFHKLAKEWHPDEHIQDGKDTTAIFQEISKAYDAIEKKKEYAYKNRMATEGQDSTYGNAKKHTSEEGSTEKKQKYQEPKGETYEEWKERFDKEFDKEIERIKKRYEENRKKNFDETIKRYSQYFGGDIEEMKRHGFTTDWEEAKKRFGFKTDWEETKNQDERASDKEETKKEPKPKSFWEKIFG
jgi:curved DNA-binding protein CbpA